jgi:hypothetical protein
VVATPAQEGRKGENYAFLVACSGYRNGLPELPFSVLETAEFRDLLLRSGFPRGNVKFLADSEQPRLLPEKAKIEKELDILLDANRIGPDDTVVVILNGHGVHFHGEKISYYCPLDARVNERETLLPLEGEGGLFEKLRQCKAGRKLLLVNACRNDPALERSLAARKVQIDTETPAEVPEGIAALFSCRPNQKSFYYDPERKESRGRKRSLFFHHLIEAWKGTYATGDKVTLEDVFREVRRRTAADADELYEQKQFPDPRREYQGEWIIRSDARVARTLDPDRAWMTGLPPEGTALELPGHTSKICSMQFVNNDRWLVVCTRGDGGTHTTPEDQNTIRPELVLWDLAGKKVLRRWTIHAGVC